MLNTIRREVIIEMVFNLGMTRFLGFKKLLDAIQKQDWERASSEMLNSKWAAQVKGRAVELAEMMKTGYQPE